MRKEYLFYIFRREHKIMRPTDKKLAIEEESSSSESSFTEEELPQTSCINFSAEGLSVVLDGAPGGGFAICNLYISHMSV